MSVFLSVVLTGRNDDYGGDFRERFFRTLRFNHRELTARGIAHEFVLTEWAPDPARPLLVDLVKATIDLNPRHTQDRAIQEDVLSTSQFGVGKNCVRHHVPQRRVVLVG